MNGNLSQRKGLLSTLGSEELESIKEAVLERLRESLGGKADKAEVNAELDKKADKSEVYTKDEIDNMSGTIRVTLSIDEGGFDWWDLRGNTEAKSTNSFIADMTASEVYDLYKEGKDIVVIDSIGLRSGYDPKVEENPDGTTMETLFKTECVYRLDSVQDDIIMFTKPDPINPLIIDYVKAYISTNTWVTGSYTADTYVKSEVDDKIGDIDAAIDKLHTYAQGLISGGDN